MRVVTGQGTFELGVTETTPTISITDYSRRVTDDFGVTTIVERGFSRRLSVRMALPFAAVDGVQQLLADLRATPAQWIADDRFQWLRVNGFYKDFEIDLSVPPVSFCTLSVEGLAETEAVTDDRSDPAPDGTGSSLMLLQPVRLTDAMLLSSSVAENDAPLWDAGATYAAGARVIAGRRIFESLVEANTGNAPDSASAAWVDVGPTNRWAMFDEALGTVTTAAGNVSVTIDAGVAEAVALLDVTATSVRVQGPGGYDRVQVAGSGAITFLDLPGTPGAITVTVMGDQVAIGTLLIGRLDGLGITEASPTAAITDYSRKEVDDFGEVTIVQRAWAKRMAARALIRTDAIDRVANRIAAVRARPSLWIGQAGVDAITIYGFFKDFSIEVGPSVAKLSLSVEGLSRTEPVRPGPGEPVNWTDIVDNDPARPKPQDGADKTSENVSKDTEAVGGRPVEEIVDWLDQRPSIEQRFDELDHAVSEATDSAAANADAAAGYATTAQLARDQAQAARDASQAAQQRADDDAAAAAVSAASADGFAQTASGQATIAVQKADEAGQSASTATAQADIAATKAGEASVFRNQAAASESNAAGSASSAASSAGVSAQVGADSAANAANLNRSPGAALRLWSYDRQNTFAPDSRLTDLPSAFSSVNGHLRVVGPGRHVHPVAPTRVDTTKRHRAYARIRLTEDGPQPSAHVLYVTCWDANGALVGTNTWYLAQIPNFTVADGWKEISVVCGPPGRINQFDWPAGTAFARVMYRSSGTPTEVALLYLEDVEGQTAAGDSASAAATSASSAAASNDQAGQRASAAQDARVGAETARGQAEVFRGDAANSASSAAGSASQAATSQRVAAAASATRGLTPNGMFQAGTEGWIASASMEFGSWFRGPGYQVINAFGSLNASTRSPVDVSRVYRLNAQVVNHGPQAATVYVGLECYNSAGTHLGNVYMPSFVFSNTPVMPAGLAHIVSDEFTGEEGVPPVFRHGGPFPTGTVSVQPTALLNYPTGPDGTGPVASANLQIAALYLEDVTEEANARGQANAAAVSASTATAKAGEAGQSAVSASQSANTATAQNGQAQQAASAAQSYAASASASEASAASSASLSASVSGGAINKNSTFANFPAGLSIPPNWHSWVGNGIRAFGSGDTLTPGSEIEGSPWGFYQDTSTPGYGGTYGNNFAGIYQDTKGGAGYYVVSASVQLRYGIGMGGAGVLVYGLDAYGSVVASDSINFATEPDINGRALGNAVQPGTETFRFSKMVRLNDSRVAAIRIYAMTNWEGFPGTGAASMRAKGMSWLRCGYRAASTAEIAGQQALFDSANNAAAISQEAQTRAQQDGALATRIDTVTATANGLTATVSEQATAIAGKQDKTGAAWSVTAQTPQGRARIRAIADGYGSAVELDADAIALGSMQTFLVESGRATLKGDLYIVGGLLVQLSNNHMIVTGNGFGVNNEFMSWSGPPMAISQCSKANAKTYETVGGDVYTSGTIIAGVLRNAVQTSSLLLGASVSTGVVGSNGGSRVVVVSYEYVDTYQFTGAAPATSGNTYATVILSRNGVDVATLNATGTYNRTQGWSAQEPGGYSSYIAGSTTYTDNTGGSSVSYAARLVTRYAGEGGPGPQVQTNTQRISIVQQE